MKKGKQLGEYSFKATSNRVRDDDKLEINLEGTVSGFGFVVLTMTATVGSGRWDAYEVVYRDDGTITTASGKGEHKITRGRLGCSMHARRRSFQTPHLAN